MSGAAKSINLDEIKQHCRVDGNDDDLILQAYLDSAINYAEQYQGKNYSVDIEENPIETMSNSTKQAIRLMVSFWFDNRDISANNAMVRLDNKTMEAVNSLLYFERRLNI